LAFLPTIFIKLEKTGKLPIGLPLPLKLFEIAVGLVLGDLYIYRNKTENTSLHIEQSVKHEEYLYDIFKDYCKSQPKIRSKYNKITGNTNYAIRFTTRQLFCFTQLYNIFYYNGKKIVSLNIVDIITPVSLAYWAMDDGSKQQSGLN
jgi:LAGLIDADG DNA endonuclease family